MSLLAFLPTYLSLPFSSLLFFRFRTRDRRSARETIEKSEEGYIDRGGRKFVAERGIQMSIEYGGGGGRGSSISISIHERFIRVETTDAEHRRVSARRNITINLAELITGHAFN